METVRGRVRVEPSGRRVRPYLDGWLVADSTPPLLVWENPRYPTYYFPVEDVRVELVSTGKVRRSPSRGDGLVFDVRVPVATASSAAIRYADSPLEAIRDLVRFDWDAMSEWFEEDEIVYTHARDPYTRVDVLPSSRHLRVEVDGLVVAESRQPRLLFETGLPTRYYVPLADVRMDLLRPTSSQSHCPYKGTAEYWSLETPALFHPDVAWIYRTPLPEAQRISGLVSFYNEQVDIYVDDVLQERPRSRAG